MNNIAVKEITDLEEKLLKPCGEIKLPKVVPYYAELEGTLKVKELPLAHYDYTSFFDENAFFYPLYLKKELENSYVKNGKNKVSYANYLETVPIIQLSDFLMNFKESKDVESKGFFIEMTLADIKNCFKEYPILEKAVPYTKNYQRKRK